MTADGNKSPLMLDRGEQTVSRGGQRIDLPPRVFALLALLIERRGSLVTRAEILKAVWPDTHVSPANVKDSVKSLRRVLGDDVKSPRYIETVRSRGYRYIGDAVLSLVAGSERARGWAALVRAPVIAVLPLGNATGSAAYDFVCDGFTEDATQGLSRFRELVVISAHSAFAVRQRAVSAAAAELGAEWIVSGVVRLQGAALRVQVELTHAPSARSAWVEAHSVPCNALPRVQRELVRAIVTSVVGNVQRQAAERAAGAKPEDRTAYERLLRARHVLARGTRDAVLRARADLRALCDELSSYAPAHAWLAETYYYEAQSAWSSNPAGAADQVLELGQRAVTLDGFDSMGHLAVAWGYYRTGRGIAMARAQLDVALRLNPNDYNNLCFASLLSVCSGEFERAVQSSLAALRRSPVLPDACLFTLGFAYYFRADYARAVRAFARMNRPSSAIHGVVAVCATYLGRRDEAEGAVRAFWAALDPEQQMALREDGANWRAYWSKLFAFQDSQHLEHLLADMRAAGLLRELASTNGRERARRPGKRHGDPSV